MKQSEMASSDTPEDNASSVTLEPFSDTNGTRRSTRNKSAAIVLQPLEVNTAASSPRVSGTNKGREYVTLKPGLITPEHKHLQKMTCQSLRKSGSQPEQCQSCIERRNDSGGCRFSGYRTFRALESTEPEPSPVAESETSVPNKIDGQDTKRKRSTEHQNGKSKKQKTKNGGLPPNVDHKNYQLVGNRESHGANEKSDECLYSMGSKPLKSPRAISDVDHYIMGKIAPVLRKALVRELEHEQQTSHPELEHPVIRIAEDPKERSLCDACATTLFIVSYICHVCGREYCIDCYEDWDDEQENVRFDMCSRNRIHKKEQIILVARACEGELKTLLDESDTYIETMINEETDEEILKTFPTRTLGDDLFSPVYELSSKSFDEDSFKYIWGLHGRPIIIKDCLERFKLPWDPQYFINNYGDEQCTLVQTCPPFEHKQAKVANFFGDFGKPHDRAAMKLKDWPPTADFAEVFPDLMADFERALPDAVAKHIQREGLYNLASRFPSGHNKPDLGPKMYNAFPATFQADGKIGGTTNLHRDITDAINFMMYATSAGSGDDDGATADGSSDEGPGAIWDIFPIAASKSIREFFDKRFPNEAADPFHRQNCYLAQEDLEILKKEYGIQSYRIHQRPGDAIMIPAGCAHQVRNTKDCIKVAVDFLSPENVEIGEYLIQENRKVSERAVGVMASKKGREAKKMSRVKKEDVLQLWKCLMFYYTGIREQLWGTGDDDNVIEICGKDSDDESHSQA